MAYIKKRGEYWRAEVRRKGHKPVYRTFDTQLEAQKWARRLEAEIDTGFYVDNSAAQKMTLGAALEQYRRDVAAKKRHPAQENERIDRWLRSDLCYRTLANLKGADFAKYRDQRRAQGRAENTIRLELQLVSHLYEIARKEWGMEGLMNPLKNIRKPSVSASRDRRLEPGEYEKIKDALLASGNRYAAPAFDLAIETSLRQGTLFSLQWEWVDLQTRLIRIPLSARGSREQRGPGGATAIGKGTSRPSGPAPSRPRRRASGAANRARTEHHAKRCQVYLEARAAVARRGESSMARSAARSCFTPL